MPALVSSGKDCFRPVADVTKRGKSRVDAATTDLMRPLRTDFVEAAANVICCLAYGGPLILWIEAAPSEWFSIFSRWGPSVQPWLMSLAAVAASLPLIALLVVVKKVLKLPR